MSLAGENVHWVEYLIENFGPSSLGPLLLGNRMHVFTQWCWIIVRMCEAADAHCGYDFPWSPLRLIPFSVTANYHDFHHYYNVGNFSTFFTVWDTVFD